MKNKNKNNYYNDEDQINFEKLNNFKKFNSNILNNNHSKNQIFKYSGSDEKYFNNILKTNQKGSCLNESDTRKKKKYYNSSDFQKFDQLNSFIDSHNNVEQKKDENIKSKLKYKSSDYDEFNKIIRTKNKNKTIKKDQNKKVKIIDYAKLKESEKKLKNKLGIEKIKIVYFD